MSAHPQAGAARRQSALSSERAGAICALAISWCSIVALGAAPIERAAPASAISAALTAGAALWAWRRAPQAALALAALAALAASRALWPLTPYALVIALLPIACAPAAAAPRALVIATLASCAAEIGAGALGALGALEIAWRALVLAGFGAASVAARALGAEASARDEVTPSDLAARARAFRLVHSGGGGEGVSAERAEALILTDALEALQNTTYVSLRLLKGALGAKTCVLYWLEPGGEAFAIRELVSEVDEIVEAPIDVSRGAIGGIARRREPVVLRDLRPNYRGLPYYRGAQGIRHFAGVPVLEGGRLRGVLIADRARDEAFGAEAIERLEETAAYIVRAVQNERLFTTLERRKYELGQFFDAARRLNGVIDLREVWREAIASARAVAPCDFAAITGLDAESGRHTIDYVEPDPEREAAQSGWVGREIADESGWAALAVRNGHYLPYAGQVRGAARLFSEREPMPGYKSAIAIPLAAHNKSLGALVLAHAEANVYDAARREMLDVICHQVGASLMSARLYERMEQMATRDALTGLANRRVFNERLAEAAARARRSGHSFGVLLSDIDHFKSVNDTHGHPVGDEVLRGVAALFGEALRESDFPARYGGEEFVVLLEDTDAEGCRVLAERLREAIKAPRFRGAGGQEFGVSISIGVAMWPDDADDLEELVELADQALYRSKKEGRDRVTLYKT